MRITAIGGGCQTSVFWVANVIQTPQVCCVYGRADHDFDNPPDAIYTMYVGSDWLGDT